MATPIPPIKAGGVLPRASRSDDGNQTLSDSQVHHMQAPAHTNNQLWNISNVQERRDILQKGEQNSKQTEASPADLSNGAGVAQSLVNAGGEYKGAVAKAWGQPKHPDFLGKGIASGLGGAEVYLAYEKDGVDGATIQAAGEFGSMLCTGVGRTLGAPAGPFASAGLGVVGGELCEFAFEDITRSYLQQQDNQMVGSSARIPGETGYAAPGNETHGLDVIEYQNAMQNGFANYHDHDIKAPSQTQMDSLNTATAPDIAITDMQRANATSPEAVELNGPEKLTVPASSSTLKMPPPPPMPDFIFRPGDRGETVMQIQNRLQDDGFTSLQADGIFGRNTESAVRDFQQSEGLVVDGYVGPLTLEALLD